MIGNLSHSNQRRKRNKRHPNWKGRSKSVTIFNRNGCFQHFPGSEKFSTIIWDVVLSSIMEQIKDAVLFPSPNVVNPGSRSWPWPASHRLASCQYQFQHHMPVVSSLPETCPVPDPTAYSTKQSLSTGCCTLILTVSVVTMAGWLQALSPSTELVVQNQGGKL